MLNKDAVTKNTVVILHGEVPANAPASEQDVLGEVHELSAALSRNGYNPVSEVFSLNIEATIARVKRHAPRLVFNMVESVGGCNRLMHIAPSILENEGIPFTGCGESAAFVTTNKALAKQIMRLANIPTATWQRLDEIEKHGLTVPLPLIIKPLSEDASQGIDDNSVCRTAKQCLDRVRQMQPGERRQWLAESFVDGREFNVSLLGHGNTVEVMPPAEILFVDFPADKPAIVNYNAKWVEDSFEYQATPRSFEFGAHDDSLLAELRAIALQCWHLFELTGYARVDMRTDKNGRPWVIEINCNPCITSYGGFISACCQSGHTYDDIVAHIAEDAVERVSHSPRKKV
jgi:D-alanine-D-alanine ligase